MQTLAGFVDPVTNNFPGSLYAYCSDGASIVIGSLLGTSPVTVFVGQRSLRPAARCMLSTLDITTAPAHPP